MTTTIDSPMRVRDPLTERILRLISRKRLSQTRVAQLAGMNPSTFYTRVRTGRWSFGELCDIATALDERVDVLLDEVATERAA
jgi:predicted XRE-type DNA-binding protein